MKVYKEIDPNARNNILRAWGDIRGGVLKVFVTSAPSKKSQGRIQSLMRTYGLPYNGVLFLN
jgi:hypothetical protein